MTQTTNLSKLPKWAQQEITRLRSNVAHLEDRLTSMFTQTTTKVEFEPYRHEEKRLFLPDNTHISFTLEEGNVQVRLQDGRLYIMGDSRLAHNLDVRPSSSNTLTIGFGA